MTPTEPTRENVLAAHIARLYCERDMLADQVTLLAEALASVARRVPRQDQPWGP